MEKKDSSEIINFLQSTRRKAMISAYQHFHAADQSRQAEYWFGVPVIIINVFLGSILVADISEVIPLIAKWFSAILALAAASLSGLQTFVNPKNKKTTHKRIANAYLGIERRFEILLSQYRDGLIGLPEVSKGVQELMNTYDETNALTEDYPTETADYKIAMEKIKKWEKQQGLS